MHRIDSQQGQVSIKSRIQRDIPHNTSLSYSNRYLLGYKFNFPSFKKGKVYMEDSAKA